ncbi:hypothetical protein RUND412_008852 [Rhizina undulata]
MQESSQSGNDSSSLTAARIPALPNSIFYIPNFITPAEESLLLEKIHAAPKPKWTVLSHRRLQTYPGPLSPTNVLLESPLPDWLQCPIPRMCTLGIWDSAPHRGPNHVLINEYNPREGIMPHEDGPAYYPMVATVSLGAAIVLDIFQRREGADLRAKWRILQEPRSLLVTTDQVYTSYLHGIQEHAVDEDLRVETIANWDLLGDPEMFEGGRYERKVRTSLTYRDVLKVSKVGNKLFGRR